jgi:hypothetical protein
MSAIAEAVNDLYETFRRYPHPVKIECCPCGCTEPDATAHLVATPLRDLRFLDLADYSFSAMTTQGSVDDFRYFLPRLFQGIVEEPYSYSDETLFHKLSYAKWATWPQDEQMAVKRYLNSLWLCGLASFPIEDRLPAFFEIETVLSSIAQTGESLGPYLNTWAETTAREADEHLIQFVTMYGREFANGKTLDEGFWGHAKVQAQELRRWLLQTETLQRIKDADYLLRNDGFEHLFVPSVQVLEAEAHRSA